MPTLQYNLQDFKNLKDFSKNTKIKYDLIQRRYYSGAAEWKLKHFYKHVKRFQSKLSEISRPVWSVSKTLV